MKRKELKSAVLKHIANSNRAHAALAQAFLYTGVSAVDAPAEAERICAIVRSSSDNLQVTCIAADIQFSDMFGRDDEPQHVFITVFRMGCFGYGRLVGGTDSRGNVYLLALDFRGNRPEPDTIAV